MTNDNHNPYQAPKAELSMPATPGGDFIAGGQKVPAGNALNWVREGWTLFTKAPGIWIVNVILLLVITMVLAFVPLLGSIATNVLMPIFVAGLFLGCKALDDGESLEVAHLFAGFKDRAGQLALIGVLLFVFYIVIGIVIAVLVIATFGFSLFQTAGNEQAMMQLFMGRGLLTLLLILLLVMALSIPMTMAFWFAPALVVFHGVETTAAMKQSFQACMRNILPFLVYGVVFFVLAIVAIIPVGLGFFVLVPVGYAAWYASYKDIFLRQ